MKWKTKLAASHSSHLNSALIAGMVKEVARSISLNWNALAMIYTYCIVPSVILLFVHIVLM